MKLTTRAGLALTASILCGNGLVFALEGSGTASVGPAAVVDRSRIKTRTVELPPVQVEGIYYAMEGPEVAQSFQVDPESESDSLWLLRFAVDVLNEADELESSEFLCHSMLRLERTQLEAGIPETMITVLSVSQGLAEMELPEGFAIEIDNREAVQFSAQAENNSYPEMSRELRFRATLEYVDDATAEEMGLKRLENVNLIARPEKSEPGHHAHGAHGNGAKAHGGGSMWMVPPGRHTFRSAVQAPPQDSTIHFIKAHLHPYGESIELLDKTAGEVVWRGSASTHPERRWLVNTESYSSTTGLALHDNHEYELVIVYDNTTDSPVDAMGVLRTYLLPEG